MGWPSSREHQGTVPVNRPVTLVYMLVFLGILSFRVMIVTGPVALRESCTTRRLLLYKVKGIRILLGNFNRHSNISEHHDGQPLYTIGGTEWSC